MSAQRDPDRRYRTLQPEESIISFITRWAAGEYVGGGRQLLTGMCGLDPGPLRNFPEAEADFDALARLLGISRDDFVARSLVTGNGKTRRLFGVELPSSDLERTRRLFAPSTLARSRPVPYCRAIWQVRTLPFCDETFEYLTDVCPACSTRQRWSKVHGIDLCDQCLVSLSGTPGKTVPADLHADLRLAAGVIHPDPERRMESRSALPDILRGTPEEIYALLVRLMPLVEPELTEKRQDVPRADPEIITRAMAGAWRVAAGWPDAAFHLFDQRAAIAPQRHGDGNGGRTVRFLSLGRIRTSLPAVERWVTDLRAHIELPDQAEPPADSGLIGLQEARRRLGQHGFNLARIRRAGGLSVALAFQGSRAAALYRAEEIERIRNLKDDRMAADAIAERTGIPIYGVVDLADHGLITRLDHGFFSRRFHSQQLSRTSYGTFMDRLLVGASLFDGGLKLTALAKAIGGRPKPWAAILLALLTGRLRYAVDQGPQRLVSRIRIDTVSPMEIADIVRDVFVDIGTGTISSRDAGEILNLGPLSYTRTVAPFVLRTPRQTGRCPVDRVLDLASRYIALVEFAARVGLGHRKAFFLLEGYGIPADQTAGYDRPAAEAVIEKVMSEGASNGRPSPAPKSRSGTSVEPPA